MPHGNVGQPWSHEAAKRSYDHFVDPSAQALGRQEVGRLMNGHGNEQHASGQAAVECKVEGRLRAGQNQQQYEEKDEK
jgi:hypothetical protein